MKILKFSLSVIITLTIFRAFAQHLLTKQEIIEAVNVSDIGLIQFSDPNSGAMRGNPVIVYAAKKNKLKIVKLLLREKANVNARDCRGFTALHWAAAQNNSEMLKILLEHDPKLNLVNLFNESPLFIAIKNGKTENARLILEKAEEIKACMLNFAKNQFFDGNDLLKLSDQIGTFYIYDNHGNTIVHRAIFYRNYNLILYLLEKDKNFISKKNNLGQSLLELGYGLWSLDNDFLNFIVFLKSKNYISQQDINRAKEKIELKNQAELKEFLLSLRCSDI